ncbi:hypothetical protein [Rhizobium laguerreae]|uniref:hypothetical protein n=1 Tax=Rhizobium laguerreae TaxID=1076926 RepID=UPI001C91DE5B|nr:hypothetical protein [Rhizobium laguerreae]MBY3343651.1 hypothetical protein [Rhizobium laguerreae]MBY3350685.1 hypothetical protein [Rhizobium laguerreae]MBY3371789.1 hypothetical protein [Rhizobium laguerreae]MBY3427027.1 hypothetical protein [Rhizobium laguerreae]MBY3435535.1 hypothetical protein [Rhizobium laguerreae]
MRALEHYMRAGKLEGIDEEMGAIRLIAAEEELVVAIFEWLKLNADSFHEHRDFVSKFKNHVVKLAFYPVLLQFRFILGGMLEHGVTMDGLENVLTHTPRPVVEGKRIKLALYDENGKELIRANPFAINISREDIAEKDMPQALLAELARTVNTQRGATLREFLISRADFRNQLLYASDGGSVKLGETLAELRKSFEQTFHDLLWVLALIIGGESPGKGWGLAYQFISVYRLALIEAKILKPDNTIAEPPAEA